MYSEIVLAHFQQPHRMGAIEQPDGEGTAGEPGEGPWMTIQLRIADGRVTEAWYTTYGCPAMMASGSRLTEWIEGRPAGDALAIEPAQLALILGGLPLGKEHAPELAVKALRRAAEAAAREVSK